MTIVLTSEFWIGMLCMYLLLLVDVPWRRTLWFGILNSVVLTIVLGGAISVFILALVGAIWLSLRAILLARQRFAHHRGARLGWAVILLWSLVFVYHKIGLEQPALMALMGKLRPGLPVSVVSTALIAVSFSYFFLRLIDLCKSVLWGGARLLDPLSLVGYLAPLHMLPAGPIAAYVDHERIDSERIPRPTFDRLLSGIKLIIGGLFYKVVIAESMRIFAFGIEGGVQPHGWIGASASPLSQPFPLEVWLETAYLWIYIFFDFAGYSRVARGVGVLFAVPTPDNFDKPFAATTVGDYWMRWHRSLGLFIRRNIFMPLQLHGVRRFGVGSSYGVALLSLIVAFAFTGLWHRVGLHLTLWGLAMGVWLCLEKAVRDYCLRFDWAQSDGAGRAVKMLGPVYVFVVNLVGFRFAFTEML